MREIDVPADDERWHRALVVLATAGAWQPWSSAAGTAGWRIRSSGDNADWYVTVDGCSCPAAQFYSASCKHVLAVRLHAANLSTRALSTSTAQRKHIASRRHGARLSASVARFQADQQRQENTPLKYVPMTGRSAKRPVTPSRAEHELVMLTDEELATSLPRARDRLAADPELRKLVQAAQQEGRAFACRLAPGDTTAQPRVAPAGAHRETTTTILSPLFNPHRG